MVYKNIQKLHIDDIIRLKQLIPFNDVENSILLNLESVNIVKKTIIFVKIN